MAKELYLPPTKGGKWAISRLVGGEYVHLVERSYLDDESKIRLILSVIGITPSPETINYYFPQNTKGKRCPTLSLLELFAELPPGTGRAVGV